MAVSIKSTYPAETWRFEHECVSIIRRFPFLLTILLWINVSAEFSRRYFDGEPRISKKLREVSREKRRGATPARAVAHL